MTTEHAPDSRTTAHGAPGRDEQADADALVLFGATGDLARKKLYPALYHLEERGRLDGISIVGVARSKWGTDALRGYVRDSLDLAHITVDTTV